MTYECNYKFKRNYDCINDIIINGELNNKCDLSFKCIDVFIHNVKSVLNHLKVYKTIKEYEINNTILFNSTSHVCGNQTIKINKCLYNLFSTLGYDKKYDKTYEYKSCEFLSAVCLKEVLDFYKNDKHFFKILKEYESYLERELQNLTLS
jgi:hypothetical protein